MRTLVTIAGAWFWVAVVLMAAVMSVAKAQTNYHVEWWSVDGGGGTSTGGAYSVSGTIGQADAGELRGGTFSLVGGFWGVVAAIQTPGAPLLSVVLTNGAVTVSWPRSAENWVLEEVAGLVTGPGTNAWTQVTLPYAHGDCGVRKGAFNRRWPANHRVTITTGTAQWL